MNTGRPGELYRFMITIPGYDVGQTLQHGRTVVIRAQRSADGRAVIVKQLTSVLPEPTEIVALRREFDIQRLAAGPTVVELVDFEVREGVARLVMHDDGGRSLRECMGDGDMGLARTLELGSRLARALADLHSRRIVHKDLNPSNVIVLPDRSIKLIDFGLASVVPREYAERLLPSGFAGTLAYAAPEQTGRTNRPIDARSDLYALGVTLYELLAGRVPFEATDPLGLLHAHIALTPPPLSESAPRTPAPVVALVHRLLEKAPDDRYQTALGVARDLEACAQQLRDNGEITELDVGAADRSSTLNLSTRIIGREKEIGVVSDACRRICAGGAEVLLISGAPGVGKSALASEAAGVLNAHRGRLIRGKSDLLNRSVPFAPVVEALGNWLDQILGLPQHRLQLWRDRLHDALGGSGVAVLAEVLERLVVVMGPQEAAETLPPHEAENRFRYVLQGLLRTIAQAEAPLAILIDDLQWADRRTLELFESVADDAASHLLLIGTYRDVAPEETAPVRDMIGRLRDDGIRLSHVEVGSLSEAAVTTFVEESLGQPAPALGAIIAKRTGRNIYFVRRLLMDLVDSDLLKFDAHRNEWVWDVGAVEAVRVTENVADLLGALVDSLPLETQDTLEYAAVIGSRFGLRELAGVLQSEVRVVQWSLAAAVEHDIIWPVGEGYWVAEDTGDTPGEEPSFEFNFAHDRVVEACVSRMSERRRAVVRLRVGRSLRNMLTPEAPRKLLFQVVGHLEAGSERITDVEERRDLAGLARRAAKYAMQSVSFDMANRFYEIALRDGFEDDWENNPDATAQLWTDAARAAALCADLDAMTARVEAVHKHTSAPLHRAGATNAVVEAMAAQGRPREAVDTGKRALVGLGVVLPDEPSSADVEAAIGRILTRMAEIGHERLPKLPACTNPEVLMARRLLVTIGASVYLAEPALFPLVVTTVVESTLEDGISDESAHGFILLAMVLTAVGALGEGHRIGLLATTLLEHTKTRRLHTMVRHVFNTHVRPFHDPVKRSLGPLGRVVQLGLETGDIEYASWAAHNRSVFSFYAGSPLDNVIETMRDDRRLLERNKQMAPLACHLPFYQLVTNLRERDIDGPAIDGEIVERDAALAALGKIGFRGALFLWATAQLQSHVWFRDFAGARTIAAEGLEFSDGASATLHLPTFHFYDALAHLEDPTGSSLTRAKEAHERLVASLQGGGNDDNAHRFRLLDAEFARVEGRAGDALSAYEDAAALAEVLGHSGEAGLCYERAARFADTIGARISTRTFAQLAASAYDRWGARALLAGLDELGAAAHTAPIPGGDARGAVTTTSTHTSAHGSTAELDLQGVMQASRTLSGEMHLEPLIRSLMTLLVQSAGATCAVLLMSHTEGLRVRAVHRDPAGTSIECGIMLEEATAIPRSIVRYVHRSNDRLVLANAVDDERFSDDPALADGRALSVLCVPIVHQGRQWGVAYLENNLAADAFGPRRVEVVGLLARQAAISIANAQLFEETQQMADSFARFVPQSAMRTLGRRRVRDVQLGDAVSREMAVLFADIRGFTGMLEARSAHEGIKLLNAFLGIVTPVIAAHSGFVGQFLGDGILAVFPSSAEDAIAAAIAYQRAALAAADKLGVDAPLKVVIGIDYGPIVLGAIGSERRLEVGVLGDTVNVASRLEGLAKTLDAPIIVSDSLLAAIKDPTALSVRSFGRMQIFGRREPVRIHEIRFTRTATGKLRDVPLEFQVALAAMRAERWLDAATSLEACVAFDSGDSVYRALSDVVRRAGERGPGELVKGGIRLVD